MPTTHRRVLFSQRHYWPDVPAYASFGRHIAEFLAHEGHEVTIFTGMPSYNGIYSGPMPPTHERSGGVRIRRVRMPLERPGLLGRLTDAFIFLSYLALHLIRCHNRYDLIVTTNAPPVLLAALVRYASRAANVEYVYHCQDIQPEAGVLAGAFPNGLMKRLAIQIDNTNCTEASRVVVLSQDMRESLISRGIGTKNVEVINNFVLDTHSVDVPRLSGLAETRGSFRVVFAGNIGRFQDLDPLVDAARLLRERPEITFVFMGSGAYEAELRSRASDLVDQTVFFVPHQPLDAAMAVMSECDLAVVSLARDVYRYAYPSKTMAYLLAGCRVLALLEEESELARSVASQSLGSVCSSRRPSDIASVIVREFERGGPSPSERMRIRAYAEREFGKAGVMRRWSAIVSHSRSAPSQGAEQ